MLFGTVLITGASSGIGRELAKLFAADSKQVVVHGRDLTSLESLADEMQTINPEVKVHIAQIDLLEGGAVEALKDYLDKLDLNVDVFVNNAAIGYCGEFSQMGEDDVNRLLLLDVQVSTLLLLYFSAQMSARQSGKILNMTSIVAYNPAPMNAVYSAAKSYLLSLSRTLGYELKAHNVQVSAFSPGPVETLFAKRAGLENSVAYKNSLVYMPAKVVAKKVYHAFQSGKREEIIGITNKINTLILALLPRRLSFWLLSCFS